METITDRSSSVPQSGDVDLPRNGYARVADLNKRFDDLPLGFVDAAIATLAETLGLSRVATTDRRHFAPLAAALSLELLP